MIPEHRRQFDRIGAALRRTAADPLDDFFRSELAKLYCVELSGALENLVKDCVRRYCRACANPRVANYAELEVSKLQNPIPDKIMGIVRGFDPDWESRLDAFCKGEIKDAVGSIVGNRPSSLTVLSLKRVFHLAEYPNGIGQSTAWRCLCGMTSSVFDRWS